ncbi:hypothetical protein [Chryseobacterium indologenes]|nr:hypothetical protein [Chryseobacterium indologenes]
MNTQLNMRIARGKGFEPLRMVLETIMLPFTSSKHFKKARPKPGKN